LKRDMRSTRFDLYTNEHMGLIISGTGMIKCAVATAYLVSLLSANRNTPVFNIGICGSAAKDVDIGTPLLFNKIVNFATKRAFYPDILIKHELAEETLYSFLAPVSAETVAADSHIRFVDMEAAGFMEAAGSFIPPHNLYCVKIVSDHLDCKKLDPSFVSGLIHSNMEQIEMLATAASALCGPEENVLTDADMDMLEEISHNLMLTVAMKHQFRNLAIQYKIRFNRGLDCLDPFLGTKVQTKNEGKRVYGQIAKLLSGQ